MVTKEEGKIGKTKFSIRKTSERIGKEKQERAKKAIQTG
jgi:hypothetical protein